LIITKSDVLFNHRLAEDTCIIGVKAPEIAECAQPGQFMMVRMSDEIWGHRLSRPFSFCRVENDVVEIYFRILGSGTRTMAGCFQGDSLELYGPLGCGFTIYPEAEVNIMVAGGMGSAPFPFLGLKLSQICEKAENIIFTGAKTENHIHHLDYFLETDVLIRPATDDGSVGYKGFVTELFEQELDRIIQDHNEIRVFACGPMPMLKKTAQIAADHNLSCQVSVEERMACGTGACLVCVCKTREGESSNYSRVCKEGPVFDAEQIVFD